MKKFAIITDSCSDLDKDLRDKYDIDYVKMSYLVDGKDYPASLDWEDISIRDYYNLMRDGKRIKTAQVNEISYLDAFEKYLSQGYDVLSISCSSALSASVNGSYKARDKMLEKYPDAKVICIDSLNSCSGLGIICITASKLRAEGKSIEEVADYIEAHKLEVNQLATVDSLEYLKRAGRVSAVSAVFGGMLQVKPIIISDALGQNASIEKVKGRKNSLNRLVAMFKDTYVDTPYQRVVVTHADCEEEALALKAMVEEACPNKDIEVDLRYIGPIIGATVGPGTMAIYCYGKEVTFKAEK
jgi:DegV family protein with EDD domain